MDNELELTIQACQMLDVENEQLKKRNAELMVQFEQLRKMAYEKHAVMLMKYGLDGSACKRIYALLEDLVPSQCLAKHDREVAARALKNFAAF